KSAMQVLFKVFCLGFLCSLISIGIHAQSLHSRKKIKKLIKHFVADTLPDETSISFYLVDLSTGQKIASYDENRALVPASIQKIITSSFILKETSFDFKYRTPFFLQGIKDSGSIFQGNLVVIGKGDPSLGSEYLSDAYTISQLADTIANRLLLQGINTFTGTIKLDEQFISDIPENKEWLWYDLGNYYGAGCYSINYLENEAKISLDASLINGGICEIRNIQPALFKHHYHSSVIGVQQPALNEVYVLGTSQANIHAIKGQWKCCTKDTLVIRSALMQPAKTFGEALLSSLRIRGIRFLESQGEHLDEKQLLYEYASPSLNRLVQRAMLKSVNLYAESFLHTLGFIWNGSTNRQKALDTLNEKIKGILNCEADFILEDGSGLSPKNMISAFRMVQYLQWINKQKELEKYWMLLPDNKKEGSLSKYLKILPKQKVELRLKSGSMERVRSYAGYLVKDNKPKYAISLIVNHYSCSGETMNRMIGNFVNDLMKTKL
ncbi:MAG: D-alanyl-D-alanine carboxypeptidase/D-alanyl-D-alanine-endopeptidase, partial [Saprospiraceae bacterium]